MLAWIIAVVTMLALVLWSKLLFKIMDDQMFICIGRIESGEDPDTVYKSTIRRLYGLMLAWVGGCAGIIFVAVT